MKISKPKILVSLSILSLILCLSIAFIAEESNINATIFMVFFLSTIGFGNWAGATTEKNKWNYGICEKTNEPWGFNSVDVLQDESYHYSFKSNTEYINISYMDFMDMKKHYKGINKIK